MSYSNKIVENYIRQEEFNCLETMPEENFKDKKLFVKVLRSHILYSLIELEFHDITHKINKWIDNFWATHKQCEEDEPEEIEETENEREVVIASYSVFECFKIPKGIDLKDKTQVKEYWVKYNTLYIVMVGQEDDEIEIQSEDWLENYDYKNPSKVEIDSAHNWGIDYDDEEEEDEDTLVSGIVCKTCGFELPTMLMSEHLNKENPKNKCLC